MLTFRLFKAQCLHESLGRIFTGLVWQICFVFTQIPSLGLHTCDDSYICLVWWSIASQKVIRLPPAWDHSMQLPFPPTFVSSSSVLVSVVACPGSPDISPSLQQRCCSVALADFLGERSLSHWWFAITEKELRSREGQNWKRMFC